MLWYMKHFANFRRLGGTGGTFEGASALLQVSKQVSLSSIGLSGGAPLWTHPLGDRRDGLLYDMLATCRANLDSHKGLHLPISSQISTPNPSFTVVRKRWCLGAMKGVPLKPKPSLLCLLPNHYGLVLSINPCSPPQPSSTRCAADSAKGSRQQERRGFRKVSNIRNMSRTAAIDVLFSFNFAVAFDFMFLRFRPSKAKCIGNVLTNRWNAAIRSMFFYLLYIAHCLLSHRIFLRY